jgi:hypothetical protein
MTHDVESRLEAALRRIAVAHVPDDPDQGLTRADQLTFPETGAVSTSDAAHPSQPTDTVRHRLLLGVAAGVLVLAGIGALLVLASRDSNSVSPTQPASPPEPATSPEDGPLAEVPVVTLGVSSATADADAWSRLADNQLAARSEHLVVATDGGLLVWGGFAGERPSTDGAFYDSATGQWRTVPPAPLAPDRGDAIGVWTGTEVVVINGISGNVKSAAFNPATFTWRALSDPPVDNAANASSRAVLIGDEVVLFSIFEDGAAPQNQVAILDDLQSGHWSVAESPPVALGSSVDLVAAGADMFVIGRTSDPTGCGELHVLVYTPAENSWKELSAGPASRLADPVAVWTGTELFVGGGGSCTDGVAASEFEVSAYLLSPSTGNWSTASSAPAGFYSSYRYPDLWTGNAVATISPNGQPLLYDPATDRWRLGPAIDAQYAIAPNQTPMVLFENRLVVSGGKLTANGELCCEPFGGTYAYTIPNGF